MQERHPKTNNLCLASPLTATRKLHLVRMALMNGPLLAMSGLAFARWAISWSDSWMDCINRMPNSTVSALNWQGDKGSRTDREPQTWRQNVDGYKIVGLQHFCFLCTQIFYCFVCVARDGGEFWKLNWGTLQSQPPRVQAQAKSTAEIHVLGSSPSESSRLSTEVHCCPAGPA